VANFCHLAKKEEEGQACDTLKGIFWGKKWIQVAILL
jgi:hypothetical protein